jgi:hypothetical protein
MTDNKNHKTASLPPNNKACVFFRNENYIAFFRLYCFVTSLRVYTQSCAFTLTLPWSQRWSPRLRRLTAICQRVLADLHNTKDLVGTFLSTPTPIVSTMEPRQNQTNFGRSSSMPFLPGDLARDLGLQTERQREMQSALQEIENSIGYRLMLAGTTESESQHLTDGPSTMQGSPSSSLDGADPHSVLSSPGSDETVTPSNMRKSGNRTLSSDSLTHGSPSSAPATVLQFQHNGKVTETPFGDARVYTPILPPPTRSPTTGLPKSSSAPNFGWTLTPADIEYLTNLEQSPELAREYVSSYQSGGKTPTRMSFEQASPTAKFFPSPTRSTHSYESGGVGSPLPGLGHKSSDEELQQSVGQIQGYRIDGQSPTRLAFAEDVPMNGLHHRRSSSRMSTVPLTPSRLGPGHFKDDLGSDTSGLIPSSSPPKGQLKSSVSPNSEGLLAGGGVPVQFEENEAACINAKGRSRPALYAYDPADPFVDHPPAPSSSTLPFSPSRSKTQDPPVTPSRSRFFPRPQSTDQTEAASTPTPHTNPNIYPQPAQLPNSLPFPTFPPVPRLPTLNLKIPDNPKIQAQRAARLATRQQWIKTAAKQIANLGHAHAQAFTAHSANPTAETLAKVERTRAALAAATDLDTRVAERRALFMPERKMPMRTGFGSNVEDGNAGDATMGLEGRLLGGRMAVMERVCREVVKEKESDDQGLEDKKEVRRNAVGVLRDATERRMREMER